MLKPDQIDELITTIAEMDREELIYQFRHYPAPFPIDFTDEFMKQQSIDKLRHVFAGLCMHVGKLPEPAPLARAA
jgi:hypothetical protein